MEHGLGGYSNYACRCDVCRAAAADYHKKWRASRYGTEPVKHGFSGYINWGCRCDVCRSAAAAYFKKRRAAKPPTHDN